LLFVNAPKAVSEPAELRDQLETWRREGRAVGFVPTMGNLHAGHLDLVRAVAARADRVVVSIFVNPLQFGPGEDFGAYPRTLDADLALLAREACALVFTPDESALYPRGREDTTRVDVPGLSDILCGALRPGHFSGVTTVVARLFNLVQPRFAAFGEKDFQQLTIIRRMTEDLCFPVEILPVPTRRESDGLAMSSRNRYLDVAERAAAPAIFAALQAAANRIMAGERDFVALQHSGMENMRSAGLDPEYFEVRRHEGLGLPSHGDRRLVILAAARLGRARLIDNLAVDPG
jgi:pantoate--beta-alanine ligase